MGGGGGSEVRSRGPLLVALRQDLHYLESDGEVGNC